MSTSARKTGRVKWFDAGKGFGFIHSDGIEADIFVHFSGIAMNGFKKLKEGDAVEFELSTSDKGLQALDVVPLE